MSSLESLLRLGQACEMLHDAGIRLTASEGGFTLLHSELGVERTFANFCESEIRAFRWEIAHSKELARSTALETLVTKLRAADTYGTLPG